MIKNYFIKGIKQITLNLGYEIIKKNSAPIQTNSNDPRELPYKKDLPFTIINLPIHLGVGLRIYPLHSHSFHPYIIALSNKNKNISDELFAYNVLKKFNELVNIKTLNDYFNFPNKNSIFKKNHHPLEYSYPWNRISPQEEKVRLQKTYYEENSKWGLFSDETIEFGGVSDDKLRIEAKRITTLLNSIKNYGYIPAAKDTIGCYVLMSGEKWKWMVRGGQHRAAVLSYLNYANIPVHVKKIIRREDVQVWPNVQSGIYTKSDALWIFDNIFQAVQPPCIKDWKSYIEKTY